MGLSAPLLNGSSFLGSLRCAAALSSRRSLQTRSVASSLRVRVAPAGPSPRSLGPSVFARGKKTTTTTTLELKDLPQGLISREPLEDLEEDTGPAYPTVLQQVRNNMRKFDHCVLLTRIGNFYEVSRLVSQCGLVFK